MVDTGVKPKPPPGYPWALSLAFLAVLCLLCLGSIVYRPMAALAATILICTVALDAFDFIILTRRPIRRVRLAAMFYIVTWKAWVAAAPSARRPRLRDSWLSYYGPASMVVLLGLWATGLVVGFGLLSWGLSVPLNGSTLALSDYLYLSGITFFTVGYGDITPVSVLGRFVEVSEAGTGLGLLAIVIGYFPVLYQAFSKREVGISLLDARAGSPPTAAEALRRHAQEGLVSVGEFLRDWERWSAELLESHISYPVLCFYRSQHDNQSWLAALTSILDTCTLIMVGIEGMPKRQAQLTFAMARHAVADIAQIFGTAPDYQCRDRLPIDDLDRLRHLLSSSSIRLADDDDSMARLLELRRMYEPYVTSLGDYLRMPLPPFILSTDTLDNWRRSAWGQITSLDTAVHPSEHP